MAPSAGHVCHSLVVSWNCRPGSAQSHAVSAMSSHRSRARSVADGSRRPSLSPRAHTLGALVQVPVVVALDGAHEVGRDAHRVVRVLAGHRLVGLALPVGVVLVDVQLGDALAGELERALDGDVGDAGAARAAHGLRERRVGARAGTGRPRPRRRRRAARRRSRSGAARASASPATSAATLVSSTAFQRMYRCTSGWSRSSVTIFAARRVVPPDLIAPAARSPILRKLIRPDDLPPPDRRSFSPRRSEKFEPVPEPYLKTRASRTHRSMMPPSLTRSSATDWMKQACGAGRS